MKGAAQSPPWPVPLALPHQASLQGSAVLHSSRSPLYLGFPGLLDCMETVVDLKTLPCEWQQISPTAFSSPETCICKWQIRLQNTGRQFSFLKKFYQLQGSVSSSHCHSEMFYIQILDQRLPILVISSQPQSNAKIVLKLGHDCFM